MKSANRSEGNRAGTSLSANSKTRRFGWILLTLALLFILRSTTRAPWLAPFTTQPARSSRARRVTVVEQGDWSRGVTAVTSGN
jgi:hypothetical protein